jgi:hypothetical protein
MSLKSVNTPERTELFVLDDGEEPYVFNLFFSAFV